MPKHKKQQTQSSWGTWILSCIWDTLTLKNLVRLLAVSSITTAAAMPFKNTGPNDAYPIDGVPITLTHDEGFEHLLEQSGDMTKTVECKFTSHYPGKMGARAQGYFWGTDYSSNATVCELSPVHCEQGGVTVYPNRKQSKILLFQPTDGYRKSWQHPTLSFYNVGCNYRETECTTASHVDDVTVTCTYT